MTTPIIAVDVDDVCADLLSEWCRRYRLESGDTLGPQDIHAWEINQYVKPGWKTRIFDLLKDPQFYAFVAPIEGARNAVDKLRNLGRVIFVTSCVPGTMDQKYSWLHHHGFLKSPEEFVVCKDKYLVKADVLIDDHVVNVEKFPGMAYLITQPHNRKLKTTRQRTTVTEVPALVAKHLFETSSVPF